ncbi:costars family protein ABRACL isoform X1 [Polyodon spathula]|uniref:costars family protein ABRACL isoform X1 n=1 Tax=Polyodon spathula TaxID=7913 RepID=UPI001B7E7AF9|nr:costars family protein ABRACL isoform X1 [Polyodon spathula]
MIYTAHYTLYGRAFSFHTLPVELGEPAASALKAKRKKGELRLAEEMNVEHEVQLLVEEIRRLGSPNADGKTSVKFGVLFRDDRCANLFEAMVGTLKAAKRKKIISFQGELLLQGVHDDVDVVLLQE